MKNAIRLRPHHLLCVHGFRGRGYSPAYVKNFWKVIRELQVAEAEVEFVTQADAICEPCPHRRDTKCVDEAKIAQLDHSHQQALGIAHGQKISWNEAQTLVAHKISLELFERICSPCAWKPLGYCREALETLHKVHEVAGRMGGRFLTIVFAAALFCSWGAPRSAFADIEKAKNELQADLKAPNNQATLSIDEVAKSLNVLKKKDPGFEALRIGMDHIKKKQFSSALAHLKPAGRLAEFGDYFHYLSGVAELGLLRSKGLKAGRAIVERALNHFKSTQTENTSSSLFKRASIGLGETQIEWGEILARRKGSSGALEAFEVGFEGLLLNGLLILTPQRSIVTYALLCERRPTTLCREWVQKLAGYLDKDDDLKLAKRVAALHDVPPKKKSVPNVANDLQNFQKGFFQYIAGDYNAAYLTFHQILNDNPQTGIKFRTKFWMGRCAQHTQHELQAQTLYKEVIRDGPFTYYALLSSWFGRIDLFRNIDAELPLMSREMSRDSSNISSQDSIKLQRAEKLILNRVYDLARIELKEIKISESLSNEFLVYLAYLNDRVNNHRIVFRIYGELNQRDSKVLFSSFGQKLVFPKTFWNEIETAAREFKVSPLIPLSIIKQESAFDYEAVSGASAYGLMQLIRPTAKDMDATVRVTDLFESQRNIRLGTKYIGSLIGKYNGNLILALSAYNAGPSNADRWNREIAKGLQPEEFIELIGYRETREYVQNILRNIYWYSRMFSGEIIGSLSVLSQAKR